MLAVCRCRRFVDNRLARLIGCRVIPVVVSRVVVVPGVIMVHVVISFVLNFNLVTLIVICDFDELVMVTIAIRTSYDGATPTAQQKYQNQ